MKVANEGFALLLDLLLERHTGEHDDSNLLLTFDFPEAVHLYLEVVHCFLEKLSVLFLEVLLLDFVHILDELDGVVEDF